MWEHPADGGELGREGAVVAGLLGGEDAGAQGGLVVVAAAVVGELMVEQVEENDRVGVGLGWLQD